MAMVPSLVIPENGSEAPEFTFTHTVAMAIPYRDRAVHLASFREHWRRFAADNGVPGKRVRWEIYVVEQLDNEEFARGWLLNVGFALANQSPGNIRPDCFVTQDVDLLPDPHVDYASCGLGVTQLCSAIDRYGPRGWGHSGTKTGGVVTASPEDYTATNGFSNEFAGWGGEDDDWQVRIGLAHLPLRRAPDAQGRFRAIRGNHTVRIRSKAAYNRNVQLLRKSTDNWRTDGLSSLTFRVVHRTEDKSDQALGVAVHHVWVRRAPFAVASVRLAAPSSLCGARLGDVRWTSELVGGEAFNVTALRRKAAGLVGCANRTDVGWRTVLALDLRSRSARIVQDGTDELARFYRSLGDPGRDGMLLVDHGRPEALRAAFSAAGRLVTSSLDVALCGSAADERWLLWRGGVCDRSVSASGSGLNVSAILRVYPQPIENAHAVYVCQDDVNKVQRLTLGAACEGGWGGSTWKLEDVFYVPAGDAVLVCTSAQKRRSQVLVRSGPAPLECRGADFERAFTFGLAATALPIGPDSAEPVDGLRLLSTWVRGPNGQDAVASAGTAPFVLVEGETG